LEASEIPYQETNKFSKLVVDYVNANPTIEPFVNHFPTLDNFEKQIIKKKNHTVNREVLFEALQQQNSNLSLSNQSQNNIKSLLSKDTFTVTTGHQLCIFTGPLYFLYKMLSAINLAEILQEKYPQYNFVPIFWMASEDHDFQEINHIHLFGKEIEWKSEKTGAVGHMNLDGFATVLNELRLVLGTSENAKELILLFERTYLEHENLADATRYLVNELFGEYGLIILDGDDKKLKKEIIPIIKKDVSQQGFVKTIKQCSDQLAKEYNKQAYVRDINFFKLSEGKRELIKGDITKMEIEENSERFSPNVLLRPLYQETILPNIAYVGGGAEVAYWMQLKTVFEQENIPCPILLLRNSAMLLNESQNKKREKLDFSIADLFLDEHQLQKKFILSQTEVDISLQEEIENMELIYKSILKKTTDIGLQNNIKAQLHKQKKVFKQLEEKLLRLEKKKNESLLLKISKLKSNLFPNNSLQERNDNFSSFYLTYGENFIKIIKENLNPLNPNFVVLISKDK
jgi:bacillithiol synthase